MNSFQHPCENGMLRDIFDKDMKIDFVWIPDPAGMPGNEEADKLARNLAMSETSTFHETEAKTPTEEHCT